MSLSVDIKKKYKGFTLDIKLDDNGQRLGILGASGCGKSMTLKCIAGIEKPDSGKIILNDRVLFDSEKKINLQPQKRNVGYLFQNYALFPNMTVIDNIGIGIREKKDRKSIIEKMMCMLHLEGLENRYPMQLSGGQQQRVALARILAYEPDVLLLDEPFSALDSYLKDQFQQELLEVLNRYEGNTLIVSHSRDELFRFCDNMAVIEQGRLVIIGKTIDIYHNPMNVEAARLTGCKNISRAVKISDYEVNAVDWNIKLRTNKIVEEDVKYVGIRAHDVRLGHRDELANSFTVKYTGFSEGPFENNLIISNIEEPNNMNKIWWKVTKAYWDNTLQREFPKYILLPKEHIMLLREHNEMNKSKNMLI